MRGSYMAFASSDLPDDEMFPMPQLSIANTDVLRITTTYYHRATFQHRQQIDGQRVWGSMDQEVECYRYALHSQPCRHKYRGQLTKSSGIQILALYQRTSRTGFQLGSYWACTKDAATCYSKSQVSSPVFFVMYAKTKRYLARPFPVAGAKKKQDVEYQALFFPPETKTVIPIIDLPSMYLFMSCE